VKEGENMVGILCAHVWKWTNEIKEKDRRGEAKIHCKHFCECPNVSLAQMLYANKKFFLTYYLMKTLKYTTKDTLQLRAKLFQIVRDTEIKLSWRI
jgi:hypothetical protein